MWTTTDAWQRNSLILGRGVCRTTKVVKKVFDLIQKARIELFDFFGREMFVFHGYHAWIVLMSPEGGS